MDIKKHRLDMENHCPPVPSNTKSIIKLATEKDHESLQRLVNEEKSIRGAAMKYTNSCSGNDTYSNNCAHFLSDAFIRAGYSELLPNNDCVNARCGTTAKRVIRARDMWCWFKEMALEEQSIIPKNEGFWAIFQLDEAAYWGGHVLILDTDNNSYYGTGYYPDWKQHAYKW